MMRSSFVLIVALIFHGAFASTGFSQIKDAAPLRIDQVLQLWKSELGSQLPKGRTRQLIVEHGVDFRLDTAHEQTLRNERMTPDMIALVRNQNRTAVISVQCEPVECDVRLNSEPAGKTFARVLTAPVVAKPILVEVSAVHYEQQSQTVIVNPGDQRKVAFRLEPVKGSLRVGCETTEGKECTIRVNGAFRGNASSMPLVLTGLVSGVYDVEAQAEGYQRKTEKLFVAALEDRALSFKLDRDDWVQLSSFEALGQMTRAVGDEGAMRFMGGLKNSARMSQVSDAPGMAAWKAQAAEIRLDNRLRWDLNIAGKKWTVAFDGISVRSKGDRRYSGTEFAQELEDNIRLISNLQLTDVLLKIQSGFYITKTGNTQSRTLTAESKDDRYTFQVNEDYLPQKLLHEHLVAPRSREEVEFAQYRRLKPGLSLPSVLILRFPDRPGRELILEYDAMSMGAKVKQSDF